MAYQPGRIDFAGISPSYITGLATQTASSGIPQALGQIWQGSGQSFFGNAGQALGGALAGSAINIALNSALGTNVVGPQGLSLNSGANILASTITPYVTGAVAAGINQNIQQSLKSAGAFGPILSNLGTSLVNQAFNGLANNITAATTTATNYKMFPGADGTGEAPADYGGSAYTLTDVVFSLQLANQGPQAFGESQTVNSPKTETTVPATTATSSEGAAAVSTNSGANGLKSQAMGESYNLSTTNRDVLLKQANENGYNSLNVKQLELLGNTGDIKIISNDSSGLLYYTRAEWDARQQDVSPGAPASRNSLF